MGMTTEDPRRLASAEAVHRTVEALEARNIHAIVVGNRDEALQKLKDLVPQGAQVLAVTSETLDDVGFTQYVAEDGVYDSLTRRFQEADTLEERAEMQRTLGSAPEYVVGSVQAVAETGHVVVASASGSQLSSYVFGAKNVVWVVGTQKVVPTLEDALARTYGYAFDRHKEWSPAQGHGPSSMGKVIIFESERRPDRTTVIFVNEALGW
jgi:L-lactate utilization protein LutB